MKFKIRIIDLEWLQKLFLDKLGMVFQMEYYQEETNGFPANFPRKINLITTNYYVDLLEKQKEDK
jgi:hypothetical protein